MKEFWKSKTLWFNVLSCALLVAMELGYADFQPDTELLALVAAVVNIALRFVTNKGVVLKLRS